MKRTGFGILGIPVLVFVSFAAACGDDDDGGDPLDGAAADRSTLLDGGPDGSSTDGGSNTVRDSVIVQCASTIQAPATGTCAVTASGSSGLLIKSTILTPGRVLVNGQILIDAATKKITCAECDCSGTAGASTATVVECAQAVVSPGLINAHDHLAYNNTPPHVPLTMRYDHRHEWRRACSNAVDSAKSPDIRTLGNATSEQWAWGELRQMMSGTTSLIGEVGAPNLLRNLDESQALQVGLNQPPVNNSTFPLGDASNCLHSSCTSYPTWHVSTYLDNIPVYTAHVSEGVNDRARLEFQCLSDPAHNHLLPKVAFVHAVGLLAADVDKMASAGTRVIWSARTNIDTYGDTAQVTMMDRMGITIGLGSDWMPTGSATMLRELRCIDGLNKNQYDNYFSAEDLWKMATINSAKVANMDDVIGSLAAGLYGDIAIYSTRGGSRQYHRAVLEADPQDVVLVARGGDIVSGDADVVMSAAAMGAQCDQLDVCGTMKRLCVSRELSVTLSALTTAAQNPAGSLAMEPLFYCGTPANEPSCVPFRSGLYTGVASADDPDGDGRPTASDNCPRVFNPIRPVDGAAQADADADSVGDVCDPCPLNANTTACSSGPDPNDRDRDGVANATDNCPDIANMNQANRDGDALGDACDPCPTSAAAGVCTTSIHDLRDPALGRSLLNLSVRIAGVHVTAVKRDGFYVKDATGRDYAGIFVFTRTAPMVAAQAVVPGMIVTIDGKFVLYSGNTDEIEMPTSITLDAMTGGDVTPLSITTAELNAAGGEPLEALLVRLSNVVTVKDEANDDDFQVSALSGETCATLPDPDCARISDFMLATGSGNDNIPVTMLNQTFSSITGVVDDFMDRNAVMIRTLADLAP